MKIRRSFSSEDIPATLLAVAQDENLTYGARGLLIHILMHEDEWDANALSLARHARQARGIAGEGRTAMRSLMVELKAKGYVRLQRHRAGGGRFGSYLEAFDVPVDVPPSSTNPSRASDLDDDVVYVIGEEGSSIVKIGTTSNLTTRLKGIQTGSPVRLSVIWTCTADWRLESFLHGIFQDLRMEGEWFDFEDADPIAEVSRAAERFFAADKESDG